MKLRRLAIRSLMVLTSISLALGGLDAAVNLSVDTGSRCWPSGNERVSDIVSGAAMILQGPVDSTRLPRKEQGSIEKTAPKLALDHVVVAVNDLEQAAERFRKLGFALKPGRPHANGIRNWHAKFPDGTEIELLTAPEARDDLTRKYRKLLAQGDGGAFLALYPGENAQPPTAKMPDYIFFSGLNFSPTDKPEHYQHTNTADALVAVWVADLGLAMAMGRAHSGRAWTTRGIESNVLPGRWDGPPFKMANGNQLHFVPESRATLPGRPIIGVTVRVRALSAAEKKLREGGVPFQRVTVQTRTQLLVSPRDANGIYLFFVEREAR